jgi:hypothetical protein
LDRFLITYESLKQNASLCAIVVLFVKIHHPLLTDKTLPVMNGEEIVTAGSMTFQTVQQINQRNGICNLFTEI